MAKITQKDLHKTLNNPLIEAVEQVGNLLSLGSWPKDKRISMQLVEFEKNIIKKRGKTEHGSL